MMSANPPVPGFAVAPTYQQQPPAFIGGGDPPFGGQNMMNPTAPNLDQIEKIPGYECLTFEDAILTPPTSPTWQPEQQQRKDFENFPVITAEEARDAVVQYSSEHCCYRKSFAKDMQVRDVRMSSVFHYTLQTFTEKRESSWRFEPYNGQPIDGPMNGPAPAPWDVIAMPPQFFTTNKAKVEVPHTAYVKPCHTCVGNARVRCDSCMGNGRKQCTWCNGRGMRTRMNEDERCTSCNATGYNSCFTCSGTGQVKCRTCSGKGNLKGFVQLLITWTNHVEDYISDTAAMPKELVRGVTGQLVFEEEQPRVWPISHAADQLVNNASHDLVTKHGVQFPNERMLKQKHHLRIIPIAESHYTWKEKTGNFFVYGFERKVYFETYPQKCTII